MGQNNQLEIEIPTSNLKPQNKSKIPTSKQKDFWLLVGICLEV